MQVEETGNGEEEGSDDGRLLADLDMDALVHCLLPLGLKDLCSVAQSCQRLREAAAADDVWLQQYKLRWPHRPPWTGSRGTPLGGREAYFACHTAVQQLRFEDPEECQWGLHSASPVSALLLGADHDVTVVQGSSISVWRMIMGDPGLALQRQLLQGHTARITAARCITVSELPASVSGGAGSEENFLLSASADRTIRLWGKGRLIRTLRGHTDSVTALTNRLLGTPGGGSSAVVASGGTDKTVRTWSLSGGGKGKQPLLNTLLGHEEAVVALAVTGYDPALFVSAARDCKVKLWAADVAASVGTAGSCLGSVRSSGHPSALHCTESLCYVAGGASVAALDLRSMRVVATVAVHNTSVLDMAVSPSGTHLVTGGSNGAARLWDLRGLGGDWPEPVAVLGGHTGPVSKLHIDNYKVVTAGSKDSLVRVWDARTGDFISALPSSSVDLTEGEGGVQTTGVSAVAARGPILVTGTCGVLGGTIRGRDFSDCGVPLQSQDNQGVEEEASRFWEISPKGND